MLLDIRQQGFRPQQQIQKQPPKKGSVISITAGSSLMAKQNLFLSGSSINITSRGLKGAELMVEWLSATKIERAACLISSVKEMLWEEDRERTDGSIYSSEHKDWILSCLTIFGS